jgi:hypothetical protein
MNYPTTLIIAALFCSTAAAAPEQVTCDSPCDCPGTRLVGPALEVFSWIRQQTTSQQRGARGVGRWPPSASVHNETLSAIAAIMVSIVRSIGGYKPPSPIPETQSAYHPRAQRNAFHERIELLGILMLDRSLALGLETRSVGCLG